MTEWHILTAGSDVQIEELSHHHVSGRAGRAGLRMVLSGLVLQR